jgi:hypothetical protein
MKRATLVIYACLISLTLLSWADDMNLRPSAAIPGAQGRLSVEHDSNGNSSIKIRVSHLAQPSSLSPPASNYVVWVQPEGKPAEPAGVLQVGKDLSGELTTTTPYQKFDVFITAESSPRPESPSGTEIMRGMVTQNPQNK